MRHKKQKIAALLLLVAAVITALTVYLHGHVVDVLSPAGQIGYKERELIIVALLLSLLVVVPVYAMAIGIAVKYREDNKKTKTYSPDWDRSRLFESIWWGVPIIIISILSVIAWNSAHSLDPYRSLVSSKQTLTVQVVSLDWKWLFIYPEQHIASVNMAEIPVGTPVDFEITSDTVMNSFWVPRLGGQVYSMPGMSTHLHLIADKAGSYQGSSANISGSGFAGMVFTVRAGSGHQFDQWVQTARQAPHQLDSSTYSQLTRPSKDNPVAYYSDVERGLYDGIVMKYMMPTSDTPETETGTQNSPPTPSGAQSLPKKAAATTAPKTGRET